MTHFPDTGAMGQAKARRQVCHLIARGPNTWASLSSPLAAIWIRMKTRIAAECFSHWATALVPEYLIVFNPWATPDTISSRYFHSGREDLWTYTQTQSGKLKIEMKNLHNQCMNGTCSSEWERWTENNVGNRNVVHGSEATDFDAGIPCGYQFKSQLLHSQSNSLIMCIEKQRSMGQVFGPLFPHGMSKGSSLLLALAWLCPVVVTIWNKPTDGRYLSRPRFLCNWLSNESINTF